MLCPQLSTGDHDTYCVLLVYKAKAVGAYLLQKPSGEVTGLVTAAKASADAALEEGETVEISADAFPVDLNKKPSPIGGGGRAKRGRMRGAFVLLLFRGQYWQCRPHQSVLRTASPREKPFTHLQTSTYPSAVRTPHRTASSTAGSLVRWMDLALHVAVGQHRDQTRHSLPRAAPGVSRTGPPSSVRRPERP